MLFGDLGFDDGLTVLFCEVGGRIPIATKPWRCFYLPWRIVVYHGFPLPRAHFRTRSLLLFRFCPRLHPNCILGRGSLDLAYAILRIYVTILTGVSVQRGVTHQVDSDRLAIIRHLFVHQFCKRELCHYLFLLWYHGRMLPWPLLHSTTLILTGEGTRSVRGRVHFEFFLHLRALLDHVKCVISP